MLALEQTKEFHRLDLATQSTIRAIAETKLQSEVEFGKLEENDAKILVAVANTTEENNVGHTTTQMLVVQQLSDQGNQQVPQHLQTRDKVNEAKDDILAHVESATEVSRAEHAATRAEMQRVRHEAENQVRQLREEIHLLKIELEHSVKAIVASVGKITTREQRQMQDTSNAKFNLWVAKEIILKKLLVSPESSWSYGRRLIFHRTSSLYSSLISRKIGSRPWNCDLGS